MFFVVFENSENIITIIILCIKLSYDEVVSDPTQTVSNKMLSVSEKIIILVGNEYIFYRCFLFNYYK